MIDRESSPYLRIITAFGITRHPGGLSVTKMLLDKAGLSKESRVLDIGCGAGHTSAFVAKTYGAQVFGIDASAEAMHNAQALYKDEPYFSTMRFLEGDIACLPFSDGYFDVVLCESVLAFLKDQAQGLKEMFRVLAKRGFLALNELCLSAEGRSRAVQNYFAQPELQIYLCRPEELIGALSELGFDIVVEDEQGLDLKRQLLSDFSQFFNPKGLLLALEFLHQAATRSDVRKDILSLLKYAKDCPEGALDQLRTLAILAQK